MKAKNITHLVAIELTRRRISLIELRRRGEAVAIVRAHVAPLTVDLFNAETEIAARALRNALDEAGIKARACVVCLPMERLLVQTIAVPAIDQADVTDFLALEAERLFPHAPEDLAIAQASAVNADGTRMATLAALPVTQREALENVFHAARMRVLSLTAGIATLPADAALYVNEESVQMIVRNGQGIALMRGFDEAWVATGGDMPQEAAAEFAREMRLTLRRLPGGALAALRTIHVLGTKDARERLLRIIGSEAEQAGLQPQTAKIETLARVEAGTFTPESIAVAGGAAVLRGEPIAFEFHRARMSRFEQTLRRWMARGLLWRVAGAAGAVVLLIAAAFIWQGMRLNGLKSRWDAVAPQVAELETIQGEIRAWRPWFGDESPTLRMLRGLTEAFPESGEVWARQVEIREGGVIECAGLAKDNKAFLRMFEALSKTAGVEQLQMQQFIGDSPVQFTFRYQWTPGVTP